MQPETVARIDSDPYHFAPPGGESQCQVETRIHDYITKHVLPKIPVGGPPAIIVGHGYAIKRYTELRCIAVYAMLGLQALLTGTPR